ncbi:MAG: hypothetical protein KR126chlam4_00037 [Candidatus Anoxychlamydiales bacterium]|uniref:Zinc-ribbon domain-containing protein n=1 Tax=marine sediment metagenome TaxID=412755 RepID=A0A0F8XVV8_9ZZZZ|nr:hypothetical protein [Candidatus Anoxychlamydiales bacterium]NGX40220.1 hypothetical protein [Candidatus Anoxychlamydiales bacterium]HEU64134.1 zinc ribbon domain-containing protein [Chlamydiota bacterium]
MQEELTKMCPSCDGSISMDAIFCPYCGSNVFEKNEDLPDKKTEDDVKSLSYEETLSSLYPPPYKPKAIQTATSKYYEEENDVEKDEDENQEKLEKKNISEKNEKNALIPTALFWLGINILVFSVLLLVFSQNGVLYLKWNAKFWFLYSIISIPLVYFGFKGLKNLD